MRTGPGDGEAKRAAEKYEEAMVCAAEAVARAAEVEEAAKLVSSEAATRAEGMAGAAKVGSPEHVVSELKSLDFIQANSESINMQWHAG